MSILVVVPESAEGRYALTAAVEEAALLDTDLVVLSVGLRKLDHSMLPTTVSSTLVERSGSQREPAELVLSYLADHPDVHRVVIGVKRRSPVGKALLGSLSQRLLLEAPVPVLAVKVPVRSPA